MQAFLATILFGLFIVGASFPATPFPIIVIAVRKKSKTTSFEYEKYKKCEYTKSLFVSPKNTCSIPPVYNYRDMYKKSYLMELWEFNESKCQALNPLFLAFIYILMLIFMVISIHHAF
jgi:hypothetical protein